MGCSELLKGLDIECIAEPRRYLQRAVFMNRSDVASFQVESSPITNNIKFTLKLNKTGYLFKSPETAGSISASFAKKSDKGLTTYVHKIEIPVIGVTEDRKTLLKQLDQGDLFAAVKFADGTIEIHGFDNGLASGNYNYQPQGAIGGSIITFESVYEEHDPPYIYTGASVDFDNLFAGLDELPGSSYNNDFNDDFDNE